MRKFTCKERRLFVNYSILNIFENEKGITKILIYSSVIEIKQINVFFFAIIITELAARSDLRRVLYARV